jgi:hypothetical protein
MSVAFADDVLFNVMAKTSPYEDEAEWIHIADIVLDSDLRASLFGDERLFFKHVRTRRDAWKYWPKQWRKDFYRGKLEPKFS